MLLVVAVAPPAVLGALWGLPGVETYEMVTSADQWRGGTDEALVAVMATLGWLAWAWMAASMAIEAVQLRRGKAKENANGLRRGLRPLLAAVVLKGALAGTALSATVGASEAMAHPHVEAEPEPEDAQQPAAAASVSAYEVVSGDTLWNIAVEHLGDGLRWREIHDLSKDGVQTHRGKITDPNLIFPGDVVLLPADAAAVAEPPGYEKVAKVYGHDVAAEVTAQAQAAEPLELESLGETFVLLDSQLQQPQPETEPVPEPQLEPVVETVVEVTVEPQGEPVTAAELAARVQDDAAGLEAPAAAESVPDLSAVEAPASDDVYDHGVSMGKVAQIALGSASLLTVGGLGVMMLKRRRWGAALRAPGETLEPLQDAAADIEREALLEVEDVAPWAEWLASTIGDFASRRPAGGPRAALAEGSEQGVQLLLSARDDQADWGPWHAQHGRNKTVLSLKRGTAGLNDDIDGWEALPLLLTVGEKLLLNFEVAGVVSVVPEDEEAGLGAEAVRGLCRAIVAEVTCRMAECEVEVWATEATREALGAAVEQRGVKVLAASEIDEEVGEQWRDAASRRTQAMLADLKLSVDDDRRDGVGVGSHLVVCTSGDAEELTETLRIAKEATHNLAVLVLGPAETETRLEVSVPAGELVVHPWGLRVTACYVNDPTAGVIKEMVDEPVRMQQRAPIGAREDSPAEGTARRPLGAPAAAAPAAGPVLSDRRQAPRFSNEHARAERAARQRRVGRGRDRRPAAAGADPRVQVLNMDAEGAARNEKRAAEPLQATAQTPTPDSSETRPQPTAAQDAGREADMAEGPAENLDEAARQEAAGDQDDAEEVEAVAGSGEELTDPAPQEPAEDEADADAADSARDDADEQTEQVAGGEDRAEDLEAAAMLEQAEDLEQADDGEVPAAVVMEAVTESGAGAEDADAVVAVAEDADGETDDETETAPAGGEDQHDGETGAVEVEAQPDGEAQYQGSLMSLVAEDANDEAVGSGAAEQAAASGPEGDTAAGTATLAPVVAMVPMPKVEAVDSDMSEAVDGDADDDVDGDADDGAALSAAQAVATAETAAEERANGEEPQAGRRLEAHDGDVGEQLPMPVDGLPESMRRVQRRHESSLLRFGPLSDATVQRLAGYRPGARWAILTAGPLRVARLDAGGQVIEVVGEAVATAALLAGSGSLSEEEAQSRLQWGSNELNWGLTLAKLREVFGDDFVDEPAAMRLEATVADLLFFEDGFAPADLQVGLELLRGEVFDGAEALWRFDMLVEHSRTLVADWCSAHAHRLLEAGDNHVAEKVATLGLLSQPLDGQLLQADMACALERGGRAAAAARVQQHWDAGDDNGESAEAALAEVMETRGELLKA